MGAALCRLSSFTFLTLRRWKEFVQWILRNGAVCARFEQRQRGLFFATPENSPRLQAVLADGYPLRLATADIGPSVRESQRNFIIQPKVGAE